MRNISYKILTLSSKREKCNNCGKLNHFKSVCRSNSVHVVQEQNINQNEIHSDNDSEDTDCFIHTVNKFHSCRPNCVSSIKYRPNALPINFKVDTGSQTNILPLAQYSLLQLKTPMLPPDSQLSSYTGGKLPVIGCIGTRHSVGIV
jgi:hypothetical protein